MQDQFVAAHQFMLTHARLLERRIFEVLYQGLAAATVGQVVRGYMNPDGGLGHALEPDLRTGASQPLFAEVGLAALHTVGHRDETLALTLCDYLADVADDRGLVSPIVAGAHAAPHAGHWGRPVEPGLNPTAGICGYLHDQGVEHNWLAQATDTCCELLIAAPPREGHTLLTAAHLADHMPDRGMAERLVAVIAAALPSASSYIPEAPIVGYGLTPLHFAPDPNSRWRALFSDGQIEGHLAEMMGRQQEDGGWPIEWEPPGPAAVLEWRGYATLEAISILVAYGKIQPFFDAV